MEVFITRSLVAGEGRCHVVFQEAGGVPFPPVLVEASVVENRIQFAVAEVGVFDGTVGADALVGTFTSERGMEQVRLPRKNSYWQ